MTNTKKRWGIIPFILSMILAGVASAIIIRFPSGTNKTLYKTVFPAIGIALALFSFFIGHFSYPRVHNLKVYLSGYLTGITGLACFVLYSVPVRFGTAMVALFLLIGINQIIILLSPSYIKYRIAKRITFIMVLFETALLFYVKQESDVTGWVVHISRAGYSSIPVIFGIAWFVVIVLFTIIRLRDEFYLGGVLSGLALFYCLIWISPAVFSYSYVVSAEIVFFTFAILFLEIGIFIHWLSRMEHRISYDPLLQIYNRNYCSKIIEEQSNIKTTPPLCVAMIDIDHFKKVNDIHGHQAGDRVLYVIAQVILREIVPDGIACRYGGEEIIVFFPGKTTKMVKEIVENVRKAIESTRVSLKNKRKKLKVTVSIGVSHSEIASQNIMDIIHAADKALYRAKKSGRNQVKTGKTLQKIQKKK